MRDELSDDARAFLTLLEQRTAGAAPASDVNADDLRARASAMIGALAGRGAEVEVADGVIAGPFGDTRVRWYNPDAAAERVLVYFHGGGWVVGDLDFEDRKLRDLAHASGISIASVDYVLAPEHPFPQPLEDCSAALDAICKQLPKAKIALGGASAGANLALGTALMEPQRISAMTLFYGVFDLRFCHASHEQFASGYWLEMDAMRHFRSLYCPQPSDWTNPAASPGLAEDLSQLPRCLVVSASHDPLVDESRELVAKMTAQGVEVIYHEYAGTLHGFTVLPDQFAEARDAIREAAAFLRSM